MVLKSLEAISRLRALIKEQGVEACSSHTHTHIKEQGVEEHSVLLSLLCCNAQGSEVPLRALTKPDDLLRREEIYHAIAQSIS